MQHFSKASFFSGEKYLGNLKPQQLKNQDAKTICNLVQLTLNLFATMLVLRNYLRFLKK